MGRSLTVSSLCLNRTPTQLADNLNMFLADFHVHSTFSDGRLHLPQVVDLYGRRGFGAIAVTDHLCENASLIGRASVYLGCSLTPATFPLYMEMLRSEAQRAWEQYRMVVLPGFELSKNSVSNRRSAHVLGIGICDFIWADGEISDLTRAIRAQGGIAVAAHPVWTRKFEKQTYFLWDNRLALSDEFDAWEVASGPYIFEEVAKTNLPKLASSDLHAPGQLRSWKTVLDCERHPEAILDAIRNKNVRFQFYEGEGDCHDTRRSTDHSMVSRHFLDPLGDMVRAATA